jgi:hypothetical protein
MSQVSFDCTPQEYRLVEQIVDRAVALSSQLSLPDFDRRSLEMDIVACHCNGCRLRLLDLLVNADDFNLIHDVFGIRRHMDRTTGKLQNCFVPRFAKEQ